MAEIRLSPSPPSPRDHIEMQFFISAVLLLATSILLARASPLPISTFNDVERRWASGDSEVRLSPLSSRLQSLPVTNTSSSAQQQIRSGISIREMTPAWPITRSSDGDDGGSHFSAALDERTMIARQVAIRRSGSTVMWDFVAHRLAGQKRRVVDVPPVVRPRKEMRYYFSS